MQNILLVGVGGTGKHTISMIQEKLNEMHSNGYELTNNVKSIVFDFESTDNKEQNKKIAINSEFFNLSEDVTISILKDRVGQKAIESWLNVDDKNSIWKSQLGKGYDEWRKKSFLAFQNLINQRDSKRKLDRIIESMVAQDMRSDFKVYVIASMPGGTGGGLFIPVTLYLKQRINKYLGRQPSCEAFLTCPDIYTASRTPEVRKRMYANTYAVMRELNAITLVTRGCNRRTGSPNQNRKAPVCYMIGSHNDPVLGVLFDSMSEKYWKPEAAPFENIYLMDKIPGLSTATAHFELLSNSLFTIASTNVGKEIEGLFSNQKAVLSQANNANAIFASMTTTQLKFPIESLFEYLSYAELEKAILSPKKDESWMSLFSLTEKNVREIKSDTDEEYAHTYSQYWSQQDNSLMKSFSSKKSLEIDEIEKVVKDYEDRYFSVIFKDPTSSNNRLEMMKDEAIAKVSNLCSQYEDEIKNQKYTVEDQRDKFLDCAKKVTTVIKDFLSNCISVVKKASKWASDGIFILDDTDENYKERWLYKNIFMNPSRVNEYNHPITIMTNLCNVEKRLYDKCRSHKNIWANDDQTFKSVCVNADTSYTANERKRSDYKNGGMTPREKAKLDRLVGDDYENNIRLAYDFDIHSSNAEVDSFAKKYIKLSTRTSVAQDLNWLSADACETITNIREKTINEQILGNVYRRLYQNIEGLIQSFIGASHKFNDSLTQLQKTEKESLEKGSVDNSSSSYILSTVYEKQRIKDEFINSKELEDVDSILGQHISDYVFNDACDSQTFNNKVAQQSEKKGLNLFTNMIPDVMNFVRLSSLGCLYRNMNLMQVMEKSERLNYEATRLLRLQSGQTDEIKKDNGSTERLKSFVNEKLSSAIENAITSIVIDSDDKIDTIKPTDQILIIMSTELANYICNHAEDYEIASPTDNDKQTIQMCVNSFVHKYSGNHSNIRCVLQHNMPIYYISIIKVVSNLTPSRLSLFHEDVGTYYHNYGEGDQEKTLKTNILYQSYCEVIKQHVIDGNDDTWNPHIGLGYYKRGHLPYISSEMEKFQDKRIVRGLFYMFHSGELNENNPNLRKIRLETGSGDYKNNPTIIIQKCEKTDNGNEIKKYYLASDDNFNYKEVEATKENKAKYVNSIIGINQVSELFGWLRSVEDIVWHCEHELDDMIKDRCRFIPQVNMGWNINLDSCVDRIKKESIYKLFDTGLFNEIESEKAKTKPAKVEASSNVNEEENKEVTKKKASNNDIAFANVNLFEFAYMLKTSEEMNRDCDDAEYLIKGALGILEEICNHCIPKSIFNDEYENLCRAVFDGLWKTFCSRHSSETDNTYLLLVQQWLTEMNCIPKMNKSLEIL